MNQELTQRTRDRYLEIINQFALDLLECNTEEEVAWAIAKNTVAKLGYVDCIVYLTSDDGRNLIQQAAHGPKNPIDLEIDSPQVLEIGEGIVGSVARSQVGEIVGNTALDPRYVVDDAARLSEITVPILYDNKTIGVIDSEHPDPEYYNEGDLEILTTIASMASVKIMQAKAMEELMESREKLQRAVNSKTKDLTSALEALRKSYEEIIASNQEKETLLKEIHHRVKNNMQIVISLLNIQINSSSSENEISVFKESQARIRSIALIHESLYATGSLSNIEAQDYIMSLVNELKGFYEASRNIEFHINIDNLKFDVERFMPIGLILNELITNSIKHAFPDNQAGNIGIELSRRDNEYRLYVCDDGVGINPNQTHRPGSIGSELIELLVEQLDGKLVQVPKDKGTCFEVYFGD